MTSSIAGFGDTIRASRSSLALGQVELAELAGVSERFVRDLEKGKLTARLDKVATVADVLGLELTLAPRVLGEGRNAWQDAL